jgi:hypothetical protein
MPSPVVWGTVFHDTMMFMALSYPENPSETYRAETEKFFKLLMDRLPCQTCRRHARNFVSKNEPLFSSSSAYVEYIIDLHNDINARTNKKSNWTREEALPAFYRRYYSNLSRLPQAEWKRKEDHRLMAEVLEDKTCSCHLKNSLSKASDSAAARQDGQRPLVVEKGFSPDTSEDYAWVVLLVFTLIFFFLSVILTVLLLKKNSQKHLAE